MLKIEFPSSTAIAAALAVLLTAAPALADQPKDPAGDADLLPRASAPAPSGALVTATVSGPTGA